MADKLCAFIQQKVAQEGPQVVTRDSEHGPRCAVITGARVSDTSGRIIVSLDMDANGPVPSRVTIRNGASKLIHAYTREEEPRGAGQSFVIGEEHTDISKLQITQPCVVPASPYDGIAWTYCHKHNAYGHVRRFWKTKILVIMAAAVSAAGFPVTVIGSTRMREQIARLARLLRIFMGPPRPRLIFEISKPTMITEFVDYGDAADNGESVNRIEASVYRLQPLQPFMVTWDSRRGADCEVGGMFIPPRWDFRRRQAQLARWCARNSISLDELRLEADTICRNILANMSSVADNDDDNDQQQVDKE